MSLRFAILLSLIVFQEAAFGQQERAEPDSSILLDISIGKKLLEDCSGSILKQSVDSFWIPVQQAVSILKSNFHKLADKVWELDHSVVQYAGIILQGKKLIYINAFPKSTLNDHIRVYGNLATSAVVVCGGGEAFWRVLFDPQLREFRNLNVNAPK